MKPPFFWDKVSLFFFFSFFFPARRFRGYTDSRVAEGMGDEDRVGFV